ncbi:MAG: hypothetical protein AB1629_03070 [Candidatus Omnitrophota bacterium]
MPKKKKPNKRKIIKILLLFRKIKVKIKEIMPTIRQIKKLKLKKFWQAIPKIKQRARTGRTSILSRLLSILFFLP